LLFKFNLCRYAAVMGVTTALGALPGYFFLNVDSYGPGHVLLYLSCLVGGLFAAVTPPNVRAVLLNVNPPVGGLDTTAHHVILQVKKRFN
jgi:hypothetical protein